MRITQRMNSSILQDVGTGRDNRVLVVSELSESMVAFATEESANFMGSSGVMVVVNTENLPIVVAGRQGRSLADSTSASLFSKHAVVAGEGDAVVIPELASAKFDLLVFYKIVVKDLFSIWNKWTIWAARLVGRPIANLNVGVHGSEVVFSAADRTRSLSPYPTGFSICTKWATLNDYLFGLFNVVLKSSPVIMHVLRAKFAAMRFPTRVAERHREIVFEVLDAKAKRANMFSRFKRWSVCTCQKMFLQESLSDICSTEFAGDSAGSFHVSRLLQFVAKVNEKFQVKSAVQLGSVFNYCL